MTAAQDLVPMPEDPLTEVAAAVLGAGRHQVLDLLDVITNPTPHPVDVVRAGDDLLPRLAHEDALPHALRLARAALRPGGLLVAAVPELDKLSLLRPTAPPPKVSGRGKDRQVTVQLWDWSPDGESYALEVVQLVRGETTWEVANTVATRHRVLSPERISDELAVAGFSAIQRLSPAECGHPFPVWVAVAPA
ncbi:hypothetical protein FHS29_003340 [Saccharothrix tamanrassetensis]|uniref:Methyltransferase n=1 Tax=Saccharothrix tamanrassetensis TaxID=1051531 RepID=A0A841CKX0_9PSEU|nr:hypothetical protein [Saccharothrix tamanrassetensis]MBB5956747.1 hypothetical protein [Saccharothrix tamanrassetensis]